MAQFDAVTNTDHLTAHQRTLDKALHAGLTAHDILKLVLQHGPAVMHVLEVLLAEPKLTSKTVPDDDFEKEDVGKPTAPHHTTPGSFGKKK